MKITLEGFSGAVKALHPKLVGDTAGVDSRNQHPGRGDLRPWRSPVTVATAPAGRQTIYRMGRDTRSDTASWLSWPTRVHLMRGYNAEDTTERTFFTGDGVPKWTNTTLALTAPPYPAATSNLGVPAPTVALTITDLFTGLDPTPVTKALTYTYVNSLGEESAPAPVAIIATTQDSMLHVDPVGTPPAGFDITKVRYYRTASGTAGDTDFFFHFEQTVATALLGVNIDNRALGEPIPTDGALTPPANLKNLTPMWNGMAAAISGKGVRVCAAFQPANWPLFNEFLPPDSTPVGLGVWGQRLLVLTTTQPQIITGASPEGLDMQPVDGQACSSEPSIVSFNHGVAYACEDGLAYYGSTGPRLLTDSLFTRDDWQAMNPSTMLAGRYEGAYVCFYTDAASVRRGFILDPLDPQGIFFLDKGYDALWFDELQDALFVLDGTNIKKWDAAAGAPMTATFRSKVFVTPPVNFSDFRIVADAYPVTLKVDATLTLRPGMDPAAASAAVAATNPTYFSDLGAGKVRITMSAAATLPQKLPGGFLAHEWQLQVETTSAVQAAVLATTVDETA